MAVPMAFRVARSLFPFALLLVLLAWSAPLEAAQDYLEPAMAAIPAGEFEMGSRRGASWEKPVHAVKVTPFEISAKPVSNAQFRSFRPAHQSPGGNAAEVPVTGVSWVDAQKYCEWLGAKTGASYRLPPEAWWERAVRGGLRQRDYPWGDEPPVPLDAADEVQPSPRPNPFGVYAVSYNLWEWTADWYSASYFRQSPNSDPPGPDKGEFRVLRGGGYRADPNSATTYSRGSARPATTSPYITFRVVKVKGVGPPPTVSETRPPAPPKVTPPPAPARIPPAARPAPPTQPAAGARATPSPAPRPAPVGAPTASTPANAVAITAISFEQSDGELVVTIATSGAAKFKTMELKNPGRLVVDVVAGRVTMRPGAGQISVGQGGVSRIRYSQFQVEPAVARTVIDLDRALGYQIEAWPTELRVRLKPKS